jgi:three-Cys-motif partner protein
MENCPRGSKKPNGNCDQPENGTGLPIQCVGPWAKDKHDYLRRYIEATRGVRRKFLQPSGSRPAGGAAFVDLFGGPGKCCVRGLKLDRIDGSPLIALGHVEAPFTKVIICDLDGENASALRVRTATHGGRVVIIEDDCHSAIDKIVMEIPQFGFNIAFVDPFNSAQLRIDTIKRLAAVRRMDLLINFPTGDKKRNFNREGFASPEDVVAEIAGLRRELEQFGYLNEQVRSMPVTNTRHVILYHLVFASKNPKGNEIWDSITKTESGGQRSLF